MLVQADGGKQSSEKTGGLAVFVKEWKWSVFALQILTSDVIHSGTAALKMQHPSTLIMISAGFNHVSLSPVLTNVKQCVNRAPTDNLVCQCEEAL